MPFLRGSWCLAAAVLLAACPAPVTPAADAGVDAGLQISPVELCERISAARCDSVARCYRAFARTTTASCRSLEQARCLADYDALRPSFDSSAVQVNSEKVLDCEERMKNSFCAPTFPPGYPAVAAHPFSDCELSTGLLRGKVASGQNCDREVECAPGTVCVKPGGVCRGTCSSYANPNEACGFGCAPGLYCETQGTQDPSDDRCAQPKGADKPCDTSLECAPELHCAAGLCKPRSRVGEPCVFDADRLSTCEPGLACDVIPFVAGQTGTCVLPVALGGACRFHWSCAAGLVCFDLDYTGFPSTAPAQPGSCQVPAPLGMTCLPTSYATYVGDACEPGTYCAKAQAKCTATPALGDGCTPSSQSCEGVRVYCKPSGSGDTGTCTGPANPSERCAFQLDAARTVTIPCASGYCDAETTFSCRSANKTIGQLCSQDGECLSSRCAVQQDRSMRCAAACQ